MSAVPSTVPSAWMNPRLRAWLLSLRPWSLPASIVPCAITGALVHVHEGADLMQPEFALGAVTVVGLHAGANLFNTYFDFRSGCDTKETADDRALVDGTVSPSSVLVSALALSLLGAACGLAVAFQRGSELLSLLLFAILLAVGYSAGGKSLKRLGLGDAVIFLMFGPLLFAGVSIATIGSAPSLVLAYSVPIGLQTVAVLHGNNARDIGADRKSGVLTFAQVLGPERCVTYHNLLFAASYAMVLVLALAQPWLGVSGDHPSGWRQLWVLLCVPWAVYASRRFSAGILHEIPQCIAQHNLLFGVILCGALSRPLFAARAMLGCLFYLGGINNILMWVYMEALVHQKLTNLIPKLPLIATRALLGSAAVGQTLCAVLFVFGVHPVTMARLLILFLAPVTVLVHDMWTIEHTHPSFQSPPTSPPGTKAVARRTVSNFPAEFDNEFVHFFKNVGMIGGLVLYIELSP
eukprot:Hpha_TRINITY_DN35578_c0_g1::TRINITY_DN35578_c0_g1_i1::g.84482::m.84482